MKLFCILSTESGIFLQTGGLQKLADIIQVCSIMMLIKNEGMVNSALNTHLSFSECIL